jgi:predicted DsbA family dithiol-disulfide isomerase
LEQLREVVDRAGLDWHTFVEAFGSARVLANLKSDVQEAVRVGLLSTPMVYVNGVEMKGIAAPDALVRTVQGVTASCSKVKTFVTDRPPSAQEKALADWEDGLLLNIPDHGGSWTRDSGLAGAAEVVVWGDYSDSESRALDRWLRQRLANGVPLRYTFRHAPANACGHEAALAAEAAGRVGQGDGFWAVHASLMGGERPKSIERLLVELAGFGVDGETFRAAMRNQATAAAVRKDLHAAESLGLPGPPLMLVDRRWVPRWRLGGEVILDRILERAAAARRGQAGPTQTSLRNQSH